MTVSRIILAFCAVLIPIRLSAQSGGVSERVAVLEAQVEALTQRLTALTQPLAVDVDCGAGQRIQAALNATQRHPAPVFITVFGVCTERIVISRSNLFIRAGAPGAGITAPAPSGNVLSVSTDHPTPKAFSVHGLTLTGGFVVVEHSSQARFTDCVITTAVFARHQSTIHLDNTLIANSGVSAENGSRLIITGGEISHNPGNGINLRAGSTALIDGDALIAGNAGDGVNGDDGSSVVLGVATITDNGTLGGAFAGVFLKGDSRVFLSSGATITANRGSGITLMDTSLAQKHRAEANIHITNNTGFGIGCSVPPAVAQVVGFTFQQGDVSGNARGNIECPLTRTESAVTRAVRPTLKARGAECKRRAKGTSRIPRQRARDCRGRHRGAGYR